VWQKRYLDRHGLQLSDLVDQLEAGRDLRDLLELPFFLALVVRMRDRLGGLDLYGVVGKLVDEALRVQGQQALLPVGVEIAREWFEDLALGLHLSGETLIRDADLDRMTIPSAATSSPREVCEWLVSRMMFQPRNDGYAFTHRLIGEALAAAALDRRDPIPELLDAIAPVISEEVRGVRADWRVPMTFLMQRNASWRAAIRERDEMQWARTVPAEPLEERREAAEWLWSRYVDWRVWIWNYELPDIVQDATALARHLRAGGLDDLVATIRGRSMIRTRGRAATPSVSFPRPICPTSISASRAERDDLSNRLRDWWPEVPFPETITWTRRSAQGSSWTINNFAAAWLHFGPALDLDLEPE
jgi:hypothetical protein